MQVEGRRNVLRTRVAGMRLRHTDFGARASPSRGCCGMEMSHFPPCTAFDLCGCIGELKTPLQGQLVHCNTRPRPYTAFQVVYCVSTFAGSMIWHLVNASVTEHRRWRVHFTCASQSELGVTCSVQRTAEEWRNRLQSAQVFHRLERRSTSLEVEFMLGAAVLASWH